MKTLNVASLFSLFLFIFQMSYASSEEMSIPLEIIEPDERGFVVESFPVSVGVVLQPGQLVGTPRGEIKDDNDASISFAATAVSYWDGPVGVGSDIKWLRLEFKASSGRDYRFILNDDELPATSEPMAEESGNNITVDAGKLKASWTKGEKHWFKTLTIDGVSVMEPTDFPQYIDVTDGNGNFITLTPCTTTHTIEKNNSETMVLRIENTMWDSSVMGTNGTCDTTQGEEYVRQVIRMHVYKDETFVKILHTFLWLPRETDIGVKELSLHFKPSLDDIAKAYVGFSDYSDLAIERDWAQKNLAIYQDDVDSFSLTEDGVEIANRDTDLNGDGYTTSTMGGWVAIENAAGTGVSMSLRNAWQTYPTRMEIDGSTGGFKINLWPSEAETMKFGLEDIVPAAISANPQHEYAGNKFYEHTAEGVSRTHEITLSFHGTSYTGQTNELYGREPYKINSLTQHPVAIRQSPESFTKVKHFGLDIHHHDNLNYPVIEQAIDTLGRLSVHRQEDLFDYGFWRFGMMRYNGGRKSLTRWIDGTQYGSQIIPWLLWLRGGDRDFFEEAEHTSRYAMDVHVNHYTTRMVNNQPALPGYMSAAGISPFPWLPFFNNKSVKLNFLSTYYNVAGYQRAWDTLQLVQTGLTASTAAVTDRVDVPINEIDLCKKPVNLDEKIRASRARESFNTSRAWALLYDETKDPSIKTHADDWFKKTFHYEYMYGLKQFCTPSIYLYSSLLQNLAFQDEITMPSPPEVPYAPDNIPDTLIEHLNSMGLPELKNYGIEESRAVLLAPWAYEKEQNEGYLSTAWDIARQMADRIPGYYHDGDSGELLPPNFQEVVAVPVSEIWEFYLQILLTGQKIAHDHGYKNDSPTSIRDTHVSLAPLTREGENGEDEEYSEILFRPRFSGDVVLNLSLKGRQNLAIGVVTGAILAPDNTVLETFTLGEGSGPVWQTSFQLDNLDSESTYTIEFKSKQTDHWQNITALATSEQAQIMHHLPWRAWFDTNHYGRSSGSIYAITNSDTITLHTTHLYPYAIRDAVTWELLHQSDFIPKATDDIEVGYANRQIVVISKGYIHQMRFNDGVGPYISTSPNNFFRPVDPLKQEQPDFIFKDDFDGQVFSEQDIDKDPIASVGVNPNWQVQESEPGLVQVVENAGTTAGKYLNMMTDTQSIAEGIAATFNAQEAGVITLTKRIKFSDMSTDNMFWFYSSGAGGKSVLLRARPAVNAGNAAGFHLWVREPNGSASPRVLIPEIHPEHWYQLSLRYDLYNKTVDVFVQLVSGSDELQNDPSQFAAIKNVPFFDATSSGVQLLKWYTQTVESFEVSMDDVSVVKDL